MTATPPSKPHFDWRPLLKPAWLAGVISVSFHGVLFAAGPTFSSLGFDQLTEETLVAESRKVPLVELTAGEQERLPNFSSPFYNFDEFGELESLAPLFENSNKLGGSDRVINSEPLLSPGRNSVPPSASGLPFGITRLESRSGASFPRAGGFPPVGSRGAGGNGGTSANGSGEGNPPPPGAEALRPDADDESSAVSSADAEAIAANSNPTNTLSPEEQLRAYTFDRALTSGEVADGSYDDWLQAGATFATKLEIGEAEAIRSVFEDAATAGILAPVSDAEASEAAATGIVRRPIEVQLEYGGGICLTEEPQKGLIGAWVSPDGELLAAPNVIRSTGYLGLDQQAISFVETLDFATVEAFSGYQFEVLFADLAEDCVEIGGQTPAASDAEAAADVDNPAAEEKAPTKESPARSGQGVTPSESTQPPRDEADAASTEDAATAPTAEE